MFDQTFLAPERSRASSLRFFVSVLMECGAIALAILLSVMVSPHLPMRQLRSLLIVPQAPLSAVAPAHVHDSALSRPGPRRFFVPTHVVPLRTFESVARSEPAPDLTSSTAAVPFGTGSAADGVIGSMGEAFAVQPPKPQSLAKAEGPVRVGGSVAEANLTNRVVPVYPPLARTAHVQGTVVFRAIIAKDGRIANLEVVSGHPLLIAAARQAVLQWRYRPTLLNGVPVEVATEITVHFSLGQS